jgi:hypothetical protein
MKGSVCACVYTLYGVEGKENIIRIRSPAEPTVTMAQDFLSSLSLFTRASASGCRPNGYKLIGMERDGWLLVLSWNAQVSQEANFYRIISASE